MIVVHIHLSEVVSCCIIDFVLGLGKMGCIFSVHQERFLQSDCGPLVVFVVDAYVVGDSYWNSSSQVEG